MMITNAFVDMTLPLTTSYIDLHCGLYNIPCNCAHGCFPSSMQKQGLYLIALPPGSPSILPSIHVALNVDDKINEFILIFISL